MTGNDKNKGRSRQPMPFAPDRPSRRTAKTRAFGAVLTAIFALGFAPALRAEVPFAQMVVDAKTGRVLHAARRSQAVLDLRHLCHPFDSLRSLRAGCGPGFGSV